MCKVICEGERKEAICDVAGKHQVVYCSKTAMLTIPFCDDSDGQYRGGYCQAASRRRNADSGAIKPNNTAQPTRRDAVAGPHAAGALACARSGCKRNGLQGSTAREPQHVRRCAKWLGDVTRVSTLHFGPAPPLGLRARAVLQLSLDLEPEAIFGRSASRRTGNRCCMQPWRGVRAVMSARSSLQTIIGSI